jgi:hypothetical protein
MVLEIRKLIEFRYRPISIKGKSDCSGKDRSRGGKRFTILYCAEPFAALSLTLAGAALQGWPCFACFGIPNSMSLSS